MKAESGGTKYSRKALRRSAKESQAVPRQQHIIETVVPIPVMSDDSEAASVLACQILVQ
jgi:hypothetical protein